MNIVKIIFWISLQILSFTSLAQINFNESSYELEVNEDITTYLFIENIEKPTIDLGNENIIGEIKEVRVNYYLIKLKALQKFAKPTSMLIIDKNGHDIPVFIVKYNSGMRIGKYLYDVKTNKFQNTSSGTNTSSAGSKIESTSESKIQKPIDTSINEIKKTYDNQIKKQDIELANLSLGKDDTTVNKTKKKLKYLREKETFISGLNTSHFLIELVNFAKSKEDKRIYYLVRVLNKTLDFEVDDVIVEIKRKVKNRGDVSDLVGNIEYSDKVIKKGNSDFVISSPDFSIDSNESVMLFITEKTEYGTGKKMELSIRYKDFTKMKIIP